MLLLQYFFIQKQLTFCGAISFWFPVTLVRMGQAISRPMINLFVSRTLSSTEGKDAAVQVCFYKTYCC